MPSPDIPSQYAVSSSFNGAVDLDLDNIHIKELPPVEHRLHAALGPMRIRLPLDFTFGISVLGVELLRFRVEGETTAVVDDPPPPS